jgi:signal transduction histidine kinase/ActR/RegA family two-component response regulator
MLRDLGKDLLVVTNDRGVVLAASELEGQGPATGADLAALPTVAHSLDPSADPDSASFAVLAFGERYYQAACVPIVQNGYTIGTLTLGEHLQPTFVNRLRESFDGEIVVATPGHVISSTLDGDLSALATHASAARGPAEIIRLGAQEFVMASLSLGLNQLGRPVELYLLRSLTRAVAPLNRALLLDLALYGSLAVMLVGVGTGLATRSTLKPFRRFVQFMGSVAGSGDYQARFDARSSSSEIRGLNDTYSQLIASLAQHHAQLEQRSRELTAANATLRDQIAVREQAERALRESEEQLRQAQKLEALGTLAGGVAHDFNNLLTVITSYAELARSDAAAGSRMWGDLDQIREAAGRAANLTGQLLAFSRKQVLQPKVIDLNDIVSRMNTMLRRLIGEHIDLTTVMPDELPRIKADPGQLEQVVLNLAVNARDAMPKGGKLSIETQAVELAEPWVSRYGSLQPGRWVMLSVSDSGVGMDEATRLRMFEPFFTTKAQGKGTGLGLATVYGIVKQSGGHIIVYSEPGRGTSFKIYFPPVDEPGEPRRAETSAGDVRGGTETILLVEDEERVRDLAQRVLQQHGYQVVTACDGLEGLGVAQRVPGPIHLLVTDVVMPNLGGRDLAVRLADIRPAMRVLFVSGYTDDAIVRQGMLDPGTNFLQKPFTPEGLARRVREVLDGAGARHGAPAAR